MSWLQNPFKSLQLSDDPGENFSSGGGGESVKEDLSVIGESISRQLRGVAAFLAPPPTAPSHQPLAAPASVATSVAAAVDKSEVGLSSQQAWSGIESDLAEIGSSLKSSLSFFSGNKAVSGISKLATTFLHLGEEEEDKGELDYHDHAVAISDEILQFAREISSRPECWTDFPLPLSDDFDMSGSQAEHALTIEQLVPGFSELREVLITNMSESNFWMIYFIMVLPRLNESDAELLSTPQIVEARNSLLMLLKMKSPEVPNSNVDQVNSHLVDSKTDEKLKEESSSMERMILPPSTTSSSVEPDTRKSENLQKLADEKPVNTHKQYDDEDVSFSDLEDEDLDLSNRRRAKAMSSASSTDGSNDWIQLNESVKSRAGYVNIQSRRDSDADSSDWLAIGESDPDN